MSDIELRNENGTIVAYDSGENKVPIRFDEGIFDSVSTTEQYINNKQLYVQDGQPNDLTDAVWLDSDAQPFSSVKVHLTSDQSISADTSSATVEFNDVVEDNREEYDGAAYEWTADEAGESDISGQIGIAQKAGGDQITTFVWVNGQVERRNNGQIADLSTGDPTTDHALPDGTYDLSAGDTVYVTFRNVTSPCTIVSDTDRTYLKIQRVD
ncbi:hypothetical protein [Haloarcula laminariae]|uniref:hypothetical protein n=1 Tax=Haloarcula laminariae TaxID=2961577 RepID=UPI0021C7F1FC|nr:hypothetical protein [Halomicroarcula laminariae]